MKPGTRATMSTLSIAVTRPRKSPVSVTWRLTTGITDTAGGGAPWAAAAPQPTRKLSAPAAMLQPRKPLRPAIELLLTAGRFRGPSSRSGEISSRWKVPARVTHQLVCPASQYLSAVPLQYRARNRALPQDQNSSADVARPSRGTQQRQPPRIKGTNHRAQEQVAERRPRGV